MTFSPAANSPWKRPHAILSLSGLVAGTWLLLAAYAMASAASDPARGFLRGLSTEAWIVCSASTLTGLGLLLFSLQAWRNSAWAEACWTLLSTRGMHRFSLGLFSLIAIFACIPAYRFQRAQAYIERLSPLTVWLVFFSGLLLLLTLLARFEFQPESARQAFQSRRTALLLTAAVIVASLGLWTAYKGISVQYPEYRYAASVPVLGWQILLALLAALTFAWAEPKLTRFKRLDLWLPAVIWILAALLWVLEPTPPSYFNPGPYAPNREYYPFSDAAFFDVGSQYLLIGEGLLAHVPFERPLYMQVLVFLHMLAGQNYVDVANLQAALLAAFVMFVYLTGKELSGRPLGLGLAVLVALRGVNGIYSAAFTDLASPKQLLTDFPTALGMALLTWLTIKWLRRPAENRLYVFWAGGLVALLSLTRTNALFALGPILLLLWILYRRRLRTALGLTVVLGAMLVASLYPWGVSNETSILEMYYLKFRDVLRVRYQIQFGEPESSKPVASALMSPVPFRAETAPLGPGFLVQGMTNNLLTSFLCLPASPQWYDLRTLLKGAYPYWDRAWDRTFPAPEAAFLLMQLAILSFGVGMAWKRARLAGLVPLLMFLAYHLANTLGRTSGGRYVVPVDWVVLVYYLLGLVEIVGWVRAAFTGGLPVEESLPALPVDEFRWPASAPWKVAGVLGLFAVIGLSPTWTEALVPPRYTEENRSAALASLEELGLFQQADLTAAQLDEFMQQPSAMVSYGRALYPRYYNKEKGEPDNAYPYRTLPYPRLAFRLLTPTGNLGVLLPSRKVSTFPNGADVIAVGCVGAESTPRSVYMDALVIFLLDENGEAQVYRRVPPAPLTCPVAPIVCNPVSGCRSGN
jgi:hypothetical protein